MNQIENNMGHDMGTEFADHGLVFRVYGLGRRLQSLRFRVLGSAQHLKSKRYL